MGVAEGFVDKSGSWYSYNGDRIGQGKENVRQFLKANPDVAEEIEKKVRAKLLPSSEPQPETDEPVEQQA